MSWLVKFLATGFGVGYAPILSGTWGSVIGIPLFLALSGLSFLPFFAVTIGLTLFAIWIAHLAIPLIQNAKKPGDPSQIVIDEIVGFLWGAGILQFAGVWNPKEGILWLVVISFILFRLFDAAKVWPVSWAEAKFRGGLGVVIDDVVAGAMAGIVGILFCILYPFIVYAFASL